jgi:hypothetical protein
MTTIIVLDWLTWFDQKIQNKKVLLLINGFNTHKAAIQTALENRSLKNTRVKFLPPNCTSVFQPLN